MVDITITPANVQYTGQDTRAVTAGATITAGQVVSLDTATNKYVLADASALATSQNVGIALNGAADGQPLDIIDGRGSGTTITIGGTVVVGQVYVVSATAGGIAPVADLLTGEYVTVLGVGTSATQIKVRKIESGVAKP